jgi:[acyl-carrier-protein] S-malonyltransferase
MPVRWRETLLTLRARGADRFLEVGPGRVLTGLAKRTLADVELVRV